MNKESPSEKIDKIMDEINKPIKVKVPNIITIDSKGKITTIFSKLFRWFRK